MTSNNEDNASLPGDEEPHQRKSIHRDNMSTAMNCANQETSKDDGDDAGVETAEIAVDQELHSTTLPGAYAVTWQPDAASIAASSEGGVEPAIDSPETGVSSDDGRMAVEAYAVDDGEIIRAEPVKRHRSVIVAAAALFVVSLVVGLSVGLTRQAAARNYSNAAPTSELGTLRSSMVTFADDQFTGYLDARQYVSDDGTTSSTGSYRLVTCRPYDCLGSDDACVVAKMYVPGCCRGGEEGCTAAEQCGEMCEIGKKELSTQCYYDPPDCRSVACLMCEKGSDGSELYWLYEHVLNVDCLNTGQGLTENGHPYKWGIFCGFCTQGCKEEENRGFGEYDCQAYYSSLEEEVYLDGGLWPCHFLQLDYCGCAPADVHDFGLGRPDKSCKTKKDCPILCEDAGPENARNICNSFPGNITWFLKENSRLGFPYIFPVDEIKHHVGMEPQDIYDIQFYGKGP